MSWVEGLVLVLLWVMIAPAITLLFNDDGEDADERKEDEYDL